MLRFSLLALFLIAHTDAYVDDVVDYNLYSVVDAIPLNHNHVEVLHKIEEELSLDLKLDFWNDPSKILKSVSIGVPNSSRSKLIALLQSSNITSFVRVNNLQKLIDQERAENPSQSSSLRNSRAFALDQYHQYEEIVTYLKTLGRDHPTIAQVELLGYTSENREINGIRIGVNSGSSKPIFYIDAGIHAREWVSPATALYIINELITKAKADQTITDLLVKYDFFIIPVTNPDGYVYTWKSNRLWRKNRSRPSPFSGCYGVDPNRNFQLGFAGASTSTNPCSDLYPGPSAFSEKESSAVKKFTEANASKIKAVLSIHSYGQMWMSPYGYVAQRPTDYNKMMDAARKAVTSLTAVSGTRYSVGSIYEVIYPTGGSSIDWQYKVTGTPYCYALELRDKGQYGFQLPKQFILPTATETWAGIKTLAQSI